MRATVAPLESAAQTEFAVTARAAGGPASPMAERRVT